MNRLARLGFAFPIRHALTSAGVYAIIAALWIRYSSSVASYFARSIDELREIETYKGYFFVAVTSALFFVFSYSVFKRIAASARILVQSQRRLVQAERDALTGLIANSIAHDFSNLLTMLRLNTERLKDMRDLPESTADSIVRLDRTVERLTELAKRLRQAGQQVLRDQPQIYDLKSAIGETIELLRGHQLIEGCAITMDVPEHLSAQGYPILVHQLLMNLILNAAEATGGRGKIFVRARRQAQLSTIEVHDDGPGIPPHQRKDVFEAFFTTKPSGSGLGLMSVRSCAEIHGGGVEVEDSDLGGAAFRVSLPDLDSPRIAQLKMPELLNKVDQEKKRHARQPELS